MLLALCTAVAVAVLIGLALVWAARGGADRCGFTDRPDGRLKRQPHPVAVVGFALWVTIPLALGAVVLLVPDAADALAARAEFLAAVSLGVGTLAVVGVIDDAWNLNVRQKLLGQFLAILALLIVCDLRVPVVSVFGGAVHLGGLAGPFAALWLLFAVNALNLLDGMDGMLGTVSGFQLLGIAAVAVFAGDGGVALVAVAAAGGLAAFLRFNRPPAAVYLGDCGSLPLGLLVGALSLEAFRHGGAFSALPALALLALPVIDTVAAIVRRVLSGRPVYRGDAEHLHHVLRRRVGSVGWALRWTAACGFVAAVAAVSATVVRADALAVVGLGGVAATLFGAGAFGRAEARLLLARFRAPQVADVESALAGGDPR